MAETISTHKPGDLVTVQVDVVDPALFDDWLKSAIYDGRLIHGCRVQVVYGYDVQAALDAKNALVRQFIERWNEGA